MSNLLLYTLAMMGLTFLIGFFVAAIIKTIANWADFMGSCHLNRKKIHEVIGNKAVRKKSMLDDVYQRLRHKANEIMNGRLHKKMAV